MTNTASPLVPANPDRPTPLRSIAATWGSVHGVAAALITALVSGGMLAGERGSLLDAALSAGDIFVAATVGLVAALAPVLAAFHTARQGEKAVTPNSDPAARVAVDGELQLVQLAVRTAPGATYTEHAPSATYTEHAPSERYTDRVHRAMADDLPYPRVTPGLGGVNTGSADPDDDPKLGV